MNHLYGKLNAPLTIKSYTGINTDTANITVDNTNNTIKVDVNTDVIATREYVDSTTGGFTGEITLDGDEELVLQIQNGRLYHEGELYTGDITFSDVTPIITLNVDKGITYFEGNRYTDTVELTGDSSGLFIKFEDGYIKIISDRDPNIKIKSGTGKNSIVANDIDNNTASGEYSFCEGGQVVIDIDTGLPFNPPLPVNESSGKFSHTEGGSNRSPGRQAHSEGFCTLAEGTNSHSQNNHTKALHKDSDAGGASTVTGRPQQTVRGKFNAVDPDALFLVGNGTSDSNRKNAFAVNADGTTKVQKQVIVEGGDPTEDNQLTRKAYVDKKLIYLDVFDLSEASFPFYDGESLIYLCGSSASTVNGGFYYNIDEMNDIYFLSQITRIANGTFALIDMKGRTVRFYLEYLNNEFRIVGFEIENTPATESYVSDYVQGYAVQKTNSAYKVYGTNQNGTQVALDFAAGSASANSIARRTSGGQLFVGDPTANGHAATKKYVDDLIAALRTELGLS